MITLQESIELHQIYFKNIFGGKHSLLISFIYHLILFIVTCLLFYSCTPNEENNCDSELQQLTTQQEDAWVRCNGYTPCISKINQDYESKKQEILNNCR